jgi:hypothetical protein
MINYYNLVTILLYYNSTVSQRQPYMSRVAVMTGSSSGIGYETSFLGRNQFAIYGKERSNVNDL